MPASGVGFSRSSDESRRFTFSNLVLGFFELTIEKKGFNGLAGNHNCYTVEGSTDNNGAGGLQFPVRPAFWGYPVLPPLPHRRTAGPHTAFGASSQEWATMEGSPSSAK